LEGKPLTVLDPVLRAGEKAAEVTLNDEVCDRTQALPASTVGKVRLINVVLSLGTSVRDVQTRRFNQEAARLDSEGLSREANRQ
jgi:thiol peroxidase